MSPLQWSLIFVLILLSTSQAHKVDISKYVNITYELPEDCHKHGADKCPYRQPFGFLLKNSSLHCPAIFENIEMERSEVLTELSTDMCKDQFLPTNPSYLNHAFTVCIYCDDKLHMKCYYHAPEKCESIEDVLDYDKGGHCSNCETTRLGTGGFHGVAHRNSYDHKSHQDFAIHNYAELENLKTDRGHWEEGKREFTELNVYGKLAVEAMMNYKHLKGRERQASKPEIEQKVRKMRGTNI